MDANCVVLLSKERIIRCCLAADYLAAVAVLRCMCGATIIRSLGTVTALVNTVYSCCSCNYRSWEGTCVNHVISLNDWWAHQPDASEWCSNPVLGWLSIKGALPWWDMVIEMRGELGRITEVCEVYNGVVSKVLGDGWLNPRILSVQSLEAHQRVASRE